MSETTNEDTRRVREAILDGDELRLRSVIEAIPAAVFLTSDNHTRVDYLSSHFTRLLGYTHDDIPTVDSWYELAYPDPEQRHAMMAHSRQELERTFRDSAHTAVIRSIVTSKDGSQRHMLWHARNLDGRLLGSGFDLTGTLRAERELIEANARFQALAANVPGVLYQLRLRADGTFHLPFASGRLQEIHGVTPEQVVDSGMPIFESVHPDDVTHIREAIETSARTLTPFCAKFRVSLPDTRTIWVETEATPEALADGSILWHGHSRDITTRVETERELREAQERLRRSERLLSDIERMSRSGGWEYLVQKNEMFWTDELYAIHELPSEGIDHLDHLDHLGHIEASLECYRPEDRETVRAAFERCIRDGVPYDLELPFTTLRGNARWVRTKTQAIIEDGQVVRVVGSVMDITERKQAEAELMLVTKAVEQSAGSIVITDPDGKIRYVNPAFTRSSGYTREEAIGQNPRFLQSGLHDRAFYENMWAAITSGRDWVGRTTNRRKDGAIFTEEAVISPVRDSAGRIVNYISTKRDITEQLRAEQERLAMQEQLHQAQKLESIGRLAGGVAHDFNNLLMVILTVAELARDDLREDDPLRQDLQEILDAGQRAASLTRQLLAFSRKQTLAPEALDLNRLIEGLKKMLGRLIGEHIALELELSEELDTILADPGQLEQVFMNLVVNARDAMPRGGTLRITTTKGHRARPGVIVTVTDTGCGMSPEVLRQIFEPFFTTKPLGRGTGLGLSTVLGIVKQSGGDIEVSSQPDKGTTFEMFFPSTHISHSPRTRRPKGGAAEGNGEKILVVEDEESLRKMIQRLLVARGYAVTTASNAGEALLLVEERGLSPDLVIADLVMPLVSGKQLVERLRRGRPKQRALYMSGYAEAPMIPDGLGDASSPFVQKPFSADELERRVREVLDGEDPPTPSVDPQGDDPLCPT